MKPTLSNCTIGQCRWPLWDTESFPTVDEAFVCGAPARKSYCDTHHKLAYEPAPKVYAPRKPKQEAPHDRINF